MSFYVESPAAILETLDNITYAKGIVASIMFA